MLQNLEQISSVYTEGLLLPPDLLGRILDPHSDLEGRTAEAYGYGGQRLNEVITTAWNRARSAWLAFQRGRDTLPPADSGLTLTRERWLLPLFNALDYGRLSAAAPDLIDNRAYPISHRRENTPIHLVSFRQDLDKRAAVGVGTAQPSPHSLMQSYLNRSHQHTWGIVSNGLALRLLRDNSSLTRQAYLEFDLAAMMGSENFSDFTLLWMVCHESRLRERENDICWLEKWAKTADDEGRRALDQLSSNVAAAIERLGTGFLQHRKNRALLMALANGELSRQDYYRQLLRLIYRLLFLFTAEDRDLLHDPAADPAARACYEAHYSTRRLRRMAERFTGTPHADLFEGLRLVMRLVGGYDNGKAKLLGLPILGSALFNDDFVADVIHCQISNRDLLEAIRDLAFVHDVKAKALRPIDYKHLGAEELGGVYESLLELHPQLNTDSGHFGLRREGGNDRKTTGSYYTPRPLIGALLDSALNPLLAEARQASDPDAAILALKVCDPACGSGSFLIAAAHRMAHALAQARTGDEDPAPVVVRTALRQVIGNCIYGVDINPMSVELCKFSLWLESLEPGKPLSFLDHHIKAGNSLIGATPALIAKGVPNEAFEPLTGDDRAQTSKIRKQNAAERSRWEANQLGFWDDYDMAANLERIAQQVTALHQISDAAIAGIRAKERRWADLNQDPDSRRAHLLADAWCAAFVWGRQNTPALPALTQLIFQGLCRDPFGERYAATRQAVGRLSQQYAFFHWHVEFPDVFSITAEGEAAENPVTGWSGGFDCVLGNPPWERIKIQEKEWFADRDSDIAKAPNAAARKAQIDALRQSNPDLWAAFQLDQRRAEGDSHFARASGRYPLTGRGDVNTYPLFTEMGRDLLAGRGRLGIIVPSGIATDDTTKFFFQDLMEKRALVSLYDFENRQAIFEGIHRSFKYCLLTLAGYAAPVETGADFIFFALNPADLDAAEKRFTLSAEDVRLLNPNTGTAATFRTRRDAEITKAIYRRVPVLVREATPEDVNPWGISFLRMFDMSNDSGLFRTAGQLEGAGYERIGNRYTGPEGEYLPLYEAKLMHQYDHRWATYEGDSPRDLTAAEKQDPYRVVVPRYWVAAGEVDNRIGATPYLIGFRDITNTTNERTAIFGVLPRAAVGHKAPLIFPNVSAVKRVAFVAMVDSLVFDYVSRQKVGGTSMAYFTLKQLPVLPPESYTPALLDFIVPRVLELTYTAWDVQAFARDLGDGDNRPPFRWDDERRFLLRCELDALYLHLYGIRRADAEYILGTFPIVRRKEEAAYGEFRTGRVVLAMYDGMTVSAEGVRFASWLNPPPADASVRHGAG